MQSIEAKFQANVNKCDICFCAYNCKERKPVIICSMHHTVCSQCANALRMKAECPFCRERIRFDKVVVNNYIYELLPDKAVTPNHRVQVEPPSGYRTWNNNSQILKNDSRSPVVNQESINNVPLQPVFPNYYEYNAPIIGSPVETQLTQSQNYISSEETSRYYCFFCIQIPFTFLNLLFALA